MDNRIDKVKKIIENNERRWVSTGRQGGYYDPRTTDVKAREIDEYYSQLFPQPLPDEELVDEVASKIYAGGEPKDEREYYLLPERRKEWHREIASDIYSALLQPKIEEAKEQERERIRRKFDVFFGHHRMKLYVRDNAGLDDFDCAMEKFWRALSGKGESKWH